MSLIEGNTGEWEMVIGIEIHAQVVTAAKLFSGAATAFGAEPNTQVALVDAALPGMLPVINRRCVELAVRTGLGLNAEINLFSVFDRKNYFYPDLPQGYQISQFHHPIVGKGEITLDLEDGTTRTVGITRLHLEQDAGKSLHDQDPKSTYVDLNRSGVALMEIVSEPDMRSAAEAAAYILKLRSILRYLGTCDGNMEQGSLRADVNLSMRRPGEDMGTRCEIKNLNSVRFVQQAIEVEARRQVEILEDGGAIGQETRLFDPGRGETRSMRSKEEAHDYRYFPDPDLLPIELDQAWVDGLKATLPELPDAKKARFIRNFGLRPEHAATLVADRAVAEEYEKTLGKVFELKAGKETASKGIQLTRDINSEIAEIPYELEIKASATDMANTIITEVFSLVVQTGKEPWQLISELDLAGRQILVDKETISRRIAKDVLAEMVKTGLDAADIVKDKGLEQITDTGAIEAAVVKVIADNPSQAEQFRGGDEKVIGWFVGQIMKATGGKANPKAVNEILRKKLKA